MALFREVSLSLVSILLSLAAASWQNPTPSTRPVPPAISQRPARDSAIVHAWKVIDSLIPVRAPNSLTRAEAKTWLQQTDWLKSLKARIENRPARPGGRARAERGPSRADRSQEHQGSAG